MTQESAEPLAYLAELLRFVAVPAAVLEVVVSEGRRDRIETWLVERLPGVAGALALSVALIYAATLSLLHLAPYLIVIYLVGGGSISGVYAFSHPRIAFHTSVLMLILLCLVWVAATVVWLVPHSWIIVLAYPFEAFATFANRSTWFGWLVPDFSSKAFLDYNENVFQKVLDSLWPWPALAARGYFFVARGAVLLVIILLQLLLLLSVGLAVLLIPTVPFLLFIKFSDRVKTRLGIVKQRIPVGASIILAIGETLGFVLKTIKFFSLGSLDHRP